MRKATGHEQHSVLPDYDAFVNVKMPDMSDLQRVYSAQDFDFRLKPGSATVGAGVVSPNITSSPDACHYGPR